MTALSAYNLQPQLVLELALGIRSPGDIAAQFQMPLAELEGMLAVPYFSQQVANKRIELERNGALFKAKCAAFADEGLMELWRIYNDVEVNKALRLDVYKYIVKLADLEPKQAANAVVGTGFSITINLPDQQVTLSTPIEGTTVQSTEEGFSPTITLPGIDLSAAPAYIPTSADAIQDLVYE